MTVQDAALYGCRIRVACIGGVATHPAHRGSGHAGACLADAMSVATADGADIMIISGDRSLYRRAGCRRVGHDFSASLPAAAPSSDTVSLRDATAADIPTLRALHHREPVHWKRDPDTWRRALSCGWVMNRESRFIVVEAHGAAAGYFIAPKAVGEGDLLQVSEYAGDRGSLLAGFARHVNVRAAGVRWHIPGADEYDRALAAARGATVSESMTSGTYIVLNAAQLVERVRPLLAEYVGTVADTVSIEERGGGYRVRAASGTHDLPDRGSVAHFLFGTREDRPTPAPPSGPLADAFPLPTLWYGVNYV